MKKRRVFFFCVIKFHQIFFVDMTVTISILLFYRKFQYFRFEYDKPGIVIAIIGSDGAEQLIHVLKNPGFCFESAVRPSIIPAGGLSAERRAYL